MDLLVREPLLGESSHWEKAFCKLTFSQKLSRQRSDMFFCPPEPALGFVEKSFSLSYLLNIHKIRQLENMEAFAYWRFNYFFSI